jgi:hypothetical protein
MNDVSNHAGEIRPSPDNVPTLTEPVENVSASMHAALDALEAEKQAFMALSTELLQQLRPEFDRLAAGLVLRTLETAWHHKVNARTENRD